MKIMKIKFGKSGDKVDAFGIRFYGDIDDAGKQLGRVSEIFSDSTDAGIIKNKRITLWFTFAKIHSYEKASKLLDDLVAGLRTEGYEIIFSSIDDLVDTTSLEYQGTPEGSFPNSQRIHGYNAAGGFSATAEKKDDKLRFSFGEIETIQEFAKKFGKMAYGRYLMKSI